MTLALTYLDDLARVRAAVSGWDPSITSAIVERSLNEIRWDFVRGGQAVALSAGAGRVDDYEFADAVPNHYRARPGGNVNLLTVNQASVETDLTGWVASSGCTIARTTAQAAHGVASIEVTSTATGTDFVDNLGAETPVTVGKTYTAVASFRAAATPRLVRVTLQFRDSVGGDVSFANGVQVTDTTTGWTQAVVTAVATPTSAKVEVSLQVFSSAISEVHYIDKIGVWEGEDTTWQLPQAAETAQITPALDGYWLKSVTRPFLNRRFTLFDFGDAVRPGRAGIFPVSGRTFPVAVTDVRLARQQDVLALTDTKDARDQLNLLLASGDPMFLHAPAGDGPESMHVTVGDTSEARTTVRHTQGRILTMPMTQTAAPHYSIVGSTNTCAGVLAAYATCAAVVADVATCQDLIEQIADASDVIVP